MAPKEVIDKSILGADHWLAKPIHPSLLFGLLSQLFAHAPAELEMIETVARAANNESSADQPDQRISVLVVDDSPLMQDIVTKQLAKLGCRSRSVGDAEAGLEALSRELYDLVLLDCELPVMDGYTMARELRRREGESHHTPIIAFTANALSGDREKCIQAGMDDYLSKPLKLQALADTIRRWTSAKARTPAMDRGVREASSAACRSETPPGDA